MDEKPSFVVKISFSAFVAACISLPFSILLLCFFLSIYTSFDEVTESVCGVSNFIPSISAVTGISPQIYFWRLANGLHSAPRLLMAVSYYRHHIFYHQLFNFSWIFHRLSQITLIFNLVDTTMFLGVTYVSNSENFPLHERIFVIFLFASSIHMLCLLIIHWMVRRKIPSLKFVQSFKMKLAFFLLNLGFIWFLSQHFYAHRFKCRANAFSWFSASEYGVAIANMGFHLTAAYDFQDFVVTTALSKFSTD